MCISVSVLSLCFGRSDRDSLAELQAVVERSSAQNKAVTGGWQWKDWKDSQIQSFQGIVIMGVMYPPKQNWMLLYEVRVLTQNTSMYVLRS